jgi:benzoyl-CoA reductase/2-hydroxyglutaryl-CoA dehydratase subunit BcrC/BadD/HgdB
MSLGKLNRTAGLHDRLSGLFRVIETLPETLSDEEVEGLSKLLPPDPGPNIYAFLDPRIRNSSIALLKMAATWLREIKEVKEGGGKVVMVPFNFPPEVIHLFRNTAYLTSEFMGILGVIALEGQGERYWDFAMGLGLPDSLCSASTISVGSLLSGEDMLPDILIQAAPGSCDANSKVHEFMARYFDIPQLFLDKPNIWHGSGRVQYGKYFRVLLEQLQEYLDEDIDQDRLQEVVHWSNRCTELYYELWDLYKFQPCPVPNIFALYIYGNRFLMWGREEGAHLLETMIKDTKRIQEEGTYPAQEESARFIWLYLPYMFDLLGFFTWMEERGIKYLVDMFVLFFPKPIDTSDTDTMIEGLIDNAWDMPMTRQMGADSIMTRWMDDIIYAINDLEANGVVYCGHHSCKQTWSVFSAVRGEIMRRTGVPTLCLHGDLWRRRVTPMSAIQEEITSFVNNVVTRKRRRIRRKIEGNR